MAQINKEAYLAARQRDCELTIQLINEVDSQLTKLGVSNRGSDADSLKLEILDKWLIEVEFSSGESRGLGQRRMWKNGAQKRFTHTIVAYRKRLNDNDFNLIEIYSPFLETLPFKTNGSFSVKKLANIIIRLFSKCLNGGGLEKC